MATLPRIYVAHLITKERLTQTVFRLVFKTTEGLVYQAGQYASWLLGNQRRPMSFAAPPNASTAEFLVDVSPGGIASNFARNIKVGDEIRFLAPYGQFVINDLDQRPLLFLATGTGIAPIRAQLLSNRSARKTTLVFGAPSPEYLFLEREFTVLSRNRTNFKFLSVCLYPAANWSGPIGHASQVGIDAVDRLANCAVYVCGSPKFVNETIELLTNQGLPRQQMHIEQYTEAQVVVN